MEKAGVISKVTEPTEWCAGVMVVQRISVAFEFSVLHGIRVVSKLRATQTAYALSGGAGKFEISAEPGRKRAYSTDIRLRVVYQRIGMGLRFCKTISKCLSSLKSVEI